ncbi:MAG: TIGR03663 family protein, partial [Phototrophicales bacterium]
MGTTTKTLSSSPNSVSYSEQLLARVYTINWEVVAWGAILLLALFTRFYELGERVMSHDESLHTHYSWELYSMGRFEHTPLMHGPLLFHMTAFFYFLFGPSDFSARIYTSLLGVAVVMFPYLFRRWLGRSGAIIAAVGLLISPMLMYYSRYIRHDIPSIFFALVMIYATMQYIDGEKTRRPIWLAVLSGAMLFMLASKEVAFI